MLVRVKQTRLDEGLNKSRDVPMRQGKQVVQISTRTLPLIKYDFLVSSISLALNGACDPSLA